MHRAGHQLGMHRTCRLWRQARLQLPRRVTADQPLVCDCLWPTLSVRERLLPGWPSRKAAAPSYGRFLESRTTAWGRKAQFAFTENCHSRVHALCLR